MSNELPAGLSMEDVQNGRWGDDDHRTIPLPFESLGSLPSSEARDPPRIQTVLPGCGRHGVRSLRRTVPRRGVP